MAIEPIHLPRPRPPADDGCWVPVTPRYLAGEGHCRCVVFDCLSSPMWRVERQRIGEYHAHGDADRLYVGLLQDDFKGDELWRVVARAMPHQAPVWHMDFGIQTPPELIAGVTAALAADADVSVEPRRYLRSKHLEDMDTVWQPLADAGWTIVCDDACYLATSPDAVATLTYAPPQKGLHELLCPEAWLLEVVPEPDLDPMWCAMFHDRAPLHLIAAFTTALSDPKPLTREQSQIPQSCRALIARA